MAYKCREELVGKRFLSIAGGSPGKAKGKTLRDWNWRAGVIRAATHRDHSNQDLQVLVEYDDVEWQKREWITVYKDNLFQIFLIEQALVWVDRQDPYGFGTILWPALTFLPLVSNVELSNNLQPVEYLLDRELAFKDYKNLKPYIDWDTTLRGVKDYADLRLAAKRWTEKQDGQKILLTTPSVLMGYRVEVYRAEGTTQWYTAVIIGYNEATRDLTVTDDTVLEEHNEDPSLVQMRLIGDGVVESIMRGENVGITPRRSRSSLLHQQNNHQLLQNHRLIRGLTGVNNGCQSNWTGRRPRQLIKAGNSPEPPDQGHSAKPQKRKACNSDETSPEPTTKTRYANRAREDLENEQQQQSRRKNHKLKKKVLEEANNSKLREIEVVVEDCLQNGSYNDPDSVTDSAPGNTEEANCDNRIDQNRVQDNLNNCIVVSGEVVQSSIGDGNDICDKASDQCDDDDDDERELSLDGRDLEVPVKVNAGDEGNNFSVVGREESAIVADQDKGILGSASAVREIIFSNLSKEVNQETDCSIRGDDDGPLCSSSPLSSRMDFNETPNSLRFADDRSDSGVSSLRSGSGDERSGSRSSALSLSDEPNNPTLGGHNNNNNNNNNSSQGPSQLPAATRSPLYVPAGGGGAAASAAALPVRVWRDPGLLLQEEPRVRHVHSVQHQSLLMSHPQVPATGQQPPTSAPTSLPAALYPPVPSMAPHPLAPHGLPSVASHPHLPLLHPPFSEMIWKQQQYAAVPSHLLGGQQPPSHAQEDMDRERLMQDRHTERMIRQEQQHREKERIERDRQEREKMEREREKQQREEKERQEQAQALHNHFEKSLRRAEQQKRVQQQQQQQQWNSMNNRPQIRTSNLAEEDRKQNELHQRERHLNVRASEPNHRSYYAAVPPKASVSSKGEYPPPPAHSRLAPGKTTDKLTSIHPSMLPKTSDLAMYSYQVHASPNAFYEPKKSSSSDVHKTMNHHQVSGLVVTKTNADGRELPNQPPPPPLMPNEGKSSVIVKHDAAASSKTHHPGESRGGGGGVSIALSPGPKLRNELMSHYITASGGGVGQKSMYEYRSPTHSPLHVLNAQQHSASPHHHSLDGKSGGHRGGGGGAGQLPPSPHHQRQSPHGGGVTAPHPHAQPHASPELARYRQEAAAAGQAMIYPNSAKGSYAFMPSATAAYTMAASTPTSSGSKPKVSSPAPHQFYGKPSAVSVVPITRPHEAQPPPPSIHHKPPPIGASVSPSPYQQVSQYHPPAMASSPAVNACPPPAHSSKPTSAINYDRPPYSGAAMPPASLSVKLLNQPGTSPPTAASAPLSIARSYPNYNLSPGPTVGMQQVQTQPLDLGVSSNKSGDGQPTSPKRKNAQPPVGAPVCLEVKKRRLDTPPGIPPPGPPQHVKPFTSGAQQQHQHHHHHHHHPPPPPVVGMNLSSGPAQLQLARVGEPSPLIANAATTIATLVNSAAYRSPAAPTCGVRSPGSLTENLPDLSVTAVTVVEVPRPASTDSTHSVPPTKPGTPLGPPPASSSPAPARNAGTPKPPTTPSPSLGNGGSVSAPNTPGGGATQTGDESINAMPALGEESPRTPVKGGGISGGSVPPSVVDSEKSNSPGPQVKGGGGGTATLGTVRHLKKAWLQRHTGEDLEDTTGLVGSGTCVTLPLNIDAPSPSPPVAVKTENPVNSIHSIGSMAVNSINKSAKSGFQSSKATAANRKTKENVNGHPAAVPGTGGKNGDDSSSSDPERGGRKSPPKRKPPKVKRKKGAAAAPSSLANKKAMAEEKKKKGDKLPVQSESGSDSEKESDSAKDSDSGASTTVSGGGGGGKKQGGGGGKEPRKRGRRPKGSKNEKGEEPRAKKPKEEPPRDPFRKPPVGVLKKTGESFLQDGPCFEVAPRLAKCRECRWTPNQRIRNMPNIFCRFYAFRKLKYNKNGQLAIAGFSSPKDALEEDVKLWIPNVENPPADLDLDTSKFVLTQVGDHFCDLLVQEKEAQEELMTEDKTIAWKRVVQGVREMCDVCETTLFNFHWACGKCGFVVCLDCYKSRRNGTIKSSSDPGKDRDEFMWLLCTNRSSHEQEKLMLTQIIADDCLLRLGKMVHEMRDLWGIEQFCACPASKGARIEDAECRDAVRAILSEKKMNGAAKKEQQQPQQQQQPKEEANPPAALNGAKEETKSSLNWLADVALAKTEDPAPVKKEPKDEEGSSSEEEGNFSTLRELLIRPSHKANGSSRAASPVPSKADKKKGGRSENGSEADAAAATEVAAAAPKTEEPAEKIELKHFFRRYNWLHKGRQQLPIRIMTLTESKILYPTVSHSWLCDGKLLRLSDPTCVDNEKIFKDQWKRGQPVIVSDVCKTIDRELWNPEAFARDFGDEKNDLVNCMTGNLVPNQPMRKFWEGFEDASKRLKDDRGQPMLLKLKDWPPGEDFADILPTRFKDLMAALPLQDYTQRSGRLNLASRLPDCFVKPDLGPKMYNAYGSALHPNKGTTNLHLDVSDAVNVMVYVGIPKDGDTDEHIKEAFRAIDEAGCDILTRRRVRDKGELPGALWHIYNARDADKIRDLLNKVTVERGGRLEPHNDPIHDQSGYLDGPLRERLYKEYGVEGYAIVQCLGDAVFIPAGAPHQVRNLHNCIKVAEDFVSPENVAHCFHLTQEFRGLSDTHMNHEDKLQIKNIIYHAVKDALGTLGSIVNDRLGRRAVAVDNADSAAECDSV